MYAFFTPFRQKINKQQLSENQKKKKQKFQFMSFKC